MALSFSDLVEAATADTALRRRRRLQPAGGPGDKIFPPTYPGDEGPRHVFEVRRIDGQDVVAVLVDSVQSQANRFEEALGEAAAAGRIRLPRVYVDFASSGLETVPDISVLDAPHRIFDAILRDSRLEGVPFRDSALGQRLRLARPHDATSLLEAAPTALLFGAWNSTGEGGGLGAKFARAITSEIVGVGVPVDRHVDPRTGEVSLRSAARKTGSRIDPLGILRSVEVYKSETDWDFAQASAGRGARKVRPSEINHGNIAPSVEMLGVTCDYLEQTTVISLAGLRRLRFGAAGAGQIRDAVARAYLAVLGLVAMTETDRQGMALRSRCDLVGEGPAPLELVSADGSVQSITLHPDDAVALHEEAFGTAVDAGFRLDPLPVRLEPEEKLVRLIEESQRRARGDQVETDAG